jgi:hypothetical protein
MQNLEIQAVTFGAGHGLAADLQKDSFVHHFRQLDLLLLYILSYSNISEPK